MKKLFALLLAFAMLMSLAGCMVGKEPEVEATEPPTQAPTEPVRKVLHILLPETMEAKAMELADLVAVETLDTNIASYTTVEEQIQLLSNIAAQSPKDGTHAVVTMPICVQPVAEEPVEDIPEETEAVDETAEQTEETEATEPAEQTSVTEDWALKLEEAFAALVEADVAYALADYIPAPAAAASVANVHYDQRQIGAAAAAYLVANGLTQKEKVIIIQGMSEAEAERTEGFKLYLQGKMEADGKTIETAWTSLENIVYSDMQGDNQDGAEVYFTNYLDSKSHASTKYIAAWDDAYVLGVLEALEGENIDAKIKKTFLEGKAVICGCGGSEAMVDVLVGKSHYTNLESLGGLQTIFYSQDMMAVALESMAAYLNGNVVEQEQLQPIVWITAENASQYQSSDLIEG